MQLSILAVFFFADMNDPVASWDWPQERFSHQPTNIVGRRFAIYLEVNDNVPSLYLVLQCGFSFRVSDFSVIANFISIFSRRDWFPILFF